MTVTTSPPSSGADQARPPDLVTVLIDDVEVSVPKGTLVIRAAEQIGIAIPRFCDHPLLAPAGACRQCLVEVATPGPDGSLRAMPKPQASCTLECTPGMVVHTQLTSAVAEKAQRGVMELLLINHPLDCPVCDKGGECPLQNQAMSNGQATSRYTETKRTFPKPIRISTQVLLDRERCILCQRCTRFSAEIAGDPFIDLQDRGAHQQIGTFSPAILGFHTELPDAMSSGDVSSGDVPTGQARPDETGQPFMSYFSGNTVQICPVGALTGAAYRFRSRPFDLVSTPGVCEHCAGGCALRVDHRRGVVTRRLAANDPDVNEEWNCDKGRWAFTWASAPDRLTSPLVRDPGSEELRPASWPEALDLAARGLAAARDRGGVGVLVGGRVGFEDAYGYAKFARTVLGSNDVDHRARVHSAEEAAFLAHAVAGTAGTLAVTYRDLERAGLVLLAGLEPEEESAAIFLRLRKGVRARGVRVVSVAPWATRGLSKLSGLLLSAAPGTEAEMLAALCDSTGGSAGSTGGQADDDIDETAAALREPGAVILVGERLAGCPGALTAAQRLAAVTGARLAWVPRRAGERGAVEAGAMPNLLPGGRPVANASARVDVAAVWGVDSLPEGPGRDTGTMLADAADGRLAGLLVGGVDPDDLPDPALARRALEAAFVVSLEVRASAVTERADVVLPVAPHPEKAGSYLNWEGRVRPFPAALSSNAMSDHRVLDALAEQLDVPLGLRVLERVRAEIEELEPWQEPRAAAPEQPSALPPRPGPQQAVLASWPLLLDAGRLQDGEPYLAGTAHRPVVRMSAATASGIGAHDGNQVSVSTPTGIITLPLVVTPMPDAVVWLPANSRPSTVHATLGAAAGDIVRIGTPNGAVSTQDGGTEPRAGGEPR